MCNLYILYCMTNCSFIFSKYFISLFTGYDRKEKMSSAINPQMDKWEMSLMSSLNCSQLFLHLITLGTKHF